MKSQVKHLLRKTCVGQVKAGPRFPKGDRQVSLTVINLRSSLWTLASGSCRLGRLWLAPSNLSPFQTKSKNAVVWMMGDGRLKEEPEARGRETRGRPTPGHRPAIASLRSSGSLQPICRLVQKTRQMMRELGEDRLSWTEDGQRILGLWPVIFLSASSGIFVSADHDTGRP